MGQIQKAKKVKLITGLITGNEAFFLTTEKKLSKKFGPLDFKSATLDFNYTDYYQAELGKELKRQFFSFKQLIPPQEISKIKIFTNKLEDSLGVSGRRIINIDPGYLDLAKLVLATTKDFSHRIYLELGIFAEVTLMFSNESYQPLDWTYPDYRSQKYIEIFNDIRRIYHAQIK
jgi:hypothetical protein